MRSKVMWAALAVMLCTRTLVTADATDTNTENKSEKAAKTVAVFSLGTVTETPKGEDFLFGAAPGVSLKDLLARMKKAAEDDDVGACLLLIDDAGFGLAQVEEIRGAVDRIKASGKKVYAHADSLSMLTYALLSDASNLSVVPTGSVWVTGFYGESPYVRGLLDMIGVTPDFLTCGKFKSAAEMFMRTEPSPEAAQMQGWLLDSLYETYVTMVAEGRGASAEKVGSWIGGGPYSAAKAKELGMIDDVMHRQDLAATLKKELGEDVKIDKKYGREKKQDLDLSSPFALIKLWGEILSGPTKEKAGKGAVAIVYVEGPIVCGSATPSPFGSDGIAYSTPIRKALDEVAADDSVKAVVLRVNSPGGSATASEIILNATKRVKDEKPLVVSMGGVAGSGGYYVACGAETIFADASTITGSIGVVGGKLATTSMWGKIGISWDETKRGANADMLSSSDVFTPEQREKMQAWMDEIYETFKGHVKAIRGDRLKKDLDEIGGGRVYTGKQALELGLVDKIGGLEDAIAFAAEQARIEDYDVRVVPRPKNFMEVLFGDLSGKNNDTDSISLKEIAAARSTSLLDAALPLLEGIDPRRVNAVRNVLRQLNTLEQERVILAMPEIVVGE